MGTNRSQTYLQQRKAFSKRRTNLEIWKGKSMAAKKSKLDPELKAKWIAELRSGKYKQARGRLKTINRNSADEGTCHCCLGVLCEIVAPEGFKESPFTTSEYTHSFNGKTEQESYPNQVKMRELGLYPSAYKKLAQMNDGEVQVGGRWTTEGPSDFNQIADYIEANL